MAYMGTPSGVTVRSRFSGVVKELPLVEVLCEECAPRIRDELNAVLEWACRMRISIRTRYVKQDEAEGLLHDDLVAQIADALADTTIIAGLNAFSDQIDFRVNLWIPGDRRNAAQDGEYQTDLMGELWLVPSKA